jgi:hypothetical protein
VNVHDMDFSHLLDGATIQTPKSEQDYIMEAIERTTGPGESRINPYRIRSYLLALHSMEVIPSFKAIRTYCNLYYGIEMPLIDPSVQRRESLPALQLLGTKNQPAS